MAAGVPRLKTQFPAGDRLCDEPLIHRLSGFISPEEGQHLIALAGPKMHAAMVSDDRQSGGVRARGRTNRLAWIPQETTPTTLHLAERISALVGLPRENAGAFQVIHYTAGQQYQRHFDAYDLSTERGQRTLLRGGQRLVTALGYLSTVEAGGETDFPVAALQVAPRIGQLLIFHNCLPDSLQRDPRSLHAGLPVETGDKWAFNLWFRSGKFRAVAG